MGGWEEPPFPQPCPYFIVVKGLKTTVSTSRVWFMTTFIHVLICRCRSARAPCLSIWSFTSLVRVRAFMFLSTKPCCNVNPAASLRSYRSIIIRGYDQVLARKQHTRGDREGGGVGTEHPLIALEKTLMAHGSHELRVSFEISTSSRWKSELGPVPLLDTSFTHTAEPVSSAHRASGSGGGSVPKRTRNVIFMSPRCPNMKCQI